MRATASRGIFDNQRMPWWDDSYKGPVPFLGPTFSVVGFLLKIAAGVWFLTFALFVILPGYPQGGLRAAQQTKAKQDLDVIRNAINLHDAQNEAIKGTRLEPLLGRYLQELPNDPWGNQYLFDSNVGICATYGADGIAGGEGGDKDLFIYYKPGLKLLSVSFKNGEFTLLFNKAIDSINEDKLLQSLKLVDSTGKQQSLAHLNMWSFDEKKTRKEEGVIILRQDRYLLTPVGKIVWIFDSSEPNSCGLCETFFKGGPLDTTIYGEKTKLYLKPPVPRKEPLVIKMSGLSRNNGGTNLTWRKHIG